MGAFFKSVKLLRSRGMSRVDNTMGSVVFVGLSLCDCFRPWCYDGLADFPGIGSNLWATVCWQLGRARITYQVLGVCAVKLVHYHFYFPLLSVPYPPTSSPSQLARA